MMSQGIGPSPIAKTATNAIAKKSNKNNNENESTRAKGDDYYLHPIADKISREK